MHFCTLCIFRRRVGRAHTDNLPLREAKRLSTRAAIDDHATRLVLEHGFDAVTVEGICSAAGISRRTFFNYVDSMETAVIGEHPRPLTEDEVSEFTSACHPNLPLVVMGCAFTMSNLFHPYTCGRAASDAIEAGELLRRRKRICQTDPRLSRQRTARYPDIHASLVDAVTSYLEAWPEERQLSSSSSQTEAMTIVAVSTTAIRLGFHLWMEGANPTSEALYARCADALEDMTRPLTKEAEKASTAL
ncbi:TetR family transcriptional regulator [Corynebacterium sp. P5848]|uniref:TetR family transcriptional regulator n=1 Tax=Corynebacterium marambiense TaxID=2765364 RepID=UPI002260A44F|nr:TetR family transcriptional regulator [Corynebacterium marambiense]MCX7542137.1 TetR family transcriptional regulator [Corynebacterium marambiense]